MFVSCSTFKTEPQMINMDSPYFGAAIEGSRIQAVKMHSTITLTCRVEINENHIKHFTKQESNNNNARRIEWLKDGKIINFEVSITRGKKFVNFINVMSSCFS